MAVRKPEVWAYDRSHLWEPRTLPLCAPQSPSPHLPRPCSPWGFCVPGPVFLRGDSEAPCVSKACVSLAGTRVTSGAREGRGAGEGEGGDSSAQEAALPCLCHRLPAACLPAWARSRLFLPAPVMWTAVPALGAWNFSEVGGEGWEAITAGGALGSGPVRQWYQSVSSTPCFLSARVSVGPLCLFVSHGWALCSWVSLWVCVCTCGLLAVSLPPVSLPPGSLRIWPLLSVLN